MATTTTKLGLRKPATSDLVNVTTDLDTPYDSIDNAVGFTICTSSTRPSTPYAGQAIYETDTKNRLLWSGSLWIHMSIPNVGSLGSITNPYSGQVVLLTTTHLLYYYNGSSWVQYTQDSATLLATLLSGSTASLGVNVSAVTLTTSSGTYALPTTGTAPSIPFVAPPSGIVKLDYTARASTNSATLGIYTFISLEVRTGSVVGSGTIIHATSDNDAIQIDVIQTISETGTCFTILTGLTPNASYNARMLYRTGTASQTITYMNQYLFCTPALA